MYNRKDNLSLEDAFRSVMPEDPPPAGVIWPWRGGTFTTFGHGQLWFNGKTRLAHRLSFLIWNGDIPKGMVVRHRYDVPADVNPNNLHLGTYADNMQDMVDRGRCVSGNSLTREQKTEVRRLINEGVSMYKIAELYGVSRMTVSRSRNV